MTLLNSPHNPRSPLPNSLQGEPGAYTGSALRLRLAEPPTRTLEARLAHALQMLGAREAPHISMLRFQARPRPSAHRQANRGHQGRRP